MCHSGLRSPSALRFTCSSASSSGFSAQERPGPAGASPEDATGMLNSRNKIYIKNCCRKVSEIKILPVRTTSIWCRNLTSTETEVLLLYSLVFLMRKTENSD